jgi:hypothetical protein
MSNRRLLLLVLAMFGLGVLVWFDRASESGGESDVVEPVRRPPVTGGGPAETALGRAEPRPTEPVPPAATAPGRRSEVKGRLDEAAPAAMPAAVPPGAADVDRDPASAPASGLPSAVASSPPEAAAVGSVPSPGPSPAPSPAIGPGPGPAADGRERPPADRKGLEAPPGSRDGEAEFSTKSDRDAADAADTADAEGPGAFPDDDQGEQPSEAARASPTSRGSPPPPRRAGTPKRPAGTGASTNPWAGVTLEKLAATVEHPLFEPSRRAWKPPPPPPRETRAPPPPPVVPPPDPSALVLMGITAGSGRAIAIVQNNATNQISRVEEGEYVDGWEVRSVGSREVVLHKEGVTAKLQLNARPRL